MTEDERMGVDLLTAVARGVIELTSMPRALEFRLPYSLSLQLALDRVELAGLTHGQHVPRSVPELLRWCRELGPERWPLTLPSGFLTPATRLIQPVAGEATRACAELASHGPAGILEQEAETLLAGPADSCGTVDRFAACRDFLIDRPVILRFDPAELLRPAVVQTWRLVRELYTPVPDRFPVDGLVYRCSGCLLLASSSTVDGSWCEGGCPPEDQKLEPSHEPEQALALPLALRLFLALPGRVERAVRRRLEGHARLLPQGTGFHRVTGWNGTSRVFQVHDRELPTLAALRAAQAAARFDGPLDVVVPDRLTASPGYRAAFHRAVPIDTRVCLLSVSEFTASCPVR